MTFLPIIINGERWWTDEKRTVVAETKSRVREKLRRLRARSVEHWVVAA